MAIELRHRIESKCWFLIMWSAHSSAINARPCLSAVRVKEPRPEMHRVIEGNIEMRATILIHECSEVFLRDASAFSNR